MTCVRGTVENDIKKITAVEFSDGGGLVTHNIIKHFLNFN